MWICFCSATRVSLSLHVSFFYIYKNLAALHTTHWKSSSMLSENNWFIIIIFCNLFEKRHFLHNWTTKHKACHTGCSCFYWTVMAVVALLLNILSIKPLPCSLMWATKAAAADSEPLQGYLLAVSSRKVVAKWRNFNWKIFFHLESSILGIRHFESIYALNRLKRGQFAQLLALRIYQQGYFLATSCSPASLWTANNEDLGRCLEGKMLFLFSIYWLMV